MKIFIKQNGEESGPYSWEQVNALIDNGELSPSDLIRVERKKAFWIPQDKHWLPLRFLPSVPGNSAPVMSRSELFISAVALVIILLYVLFA